MSFAEEVCYQSQFKSQKSILSMTRFSVEEIENKRVEVQNPREFFNSVKESKKYSSWKNLVKNTGFGNTTLKCCRRGERTFNGKIFLKLLDYLNENQKAEILYNAKFLDENWGSRKGGNQFVKNMKNRLGEEGFLKHLENIRGKGSSSSLAKWHKRMKKENPKLYSQIQRKKVKEIHFNLLQTLLKSKVLDQLTRLDLFELT